jgi:hypothetical protein
MLFLCAESPLEEKPLFIQWTDDAKLKYFLEDWEIVDLEEGKIVWRGDVALTLEEPEDEMEMMT